MTEGTEASGPNPDEVFTLLAERARVKIIEALGDAATPGRPARLSFSELRRRADISGSGRFNYHLKRLVGRFVEETDGGYRLSYPGVRVYRAIRAGTFTNSHRIDPFELDATCHVCGGPQEAAYHGCLFRVRCGGDCEAVFYRYFCPPNSLADQDRAAILRAVSERIRREIGSMASGVCPWCCGAMDTRVSSPDDGDDNPAIDHRVRHACGTCGGTVYTRPGDLLTTHPAVVSFLYRHGVDVTSRRVWRLPFAASDERTTATSSDPWRATVRVECAGETLALRLDEEASVIEVRR